MRLPKPTPRALAAAGEAYELAMSKGSLKCDAFAKALPVLIRYSREDSTPVLVPKAVRDTIDGFLAWAYPEHWRQFRERLSDGSRGTGIVDVREHVIAVLARDGWHAKVIGAALGRDRTSVICSLRDKVRPRLEGDRAFRERIQGWYARKQGAANGVAA